MDRRKALTASALAGLLPLAAFGNSFPQREIQFVIPWGAGGSNDLAARQLQKIIAEQSGANVVVENMPGATGSIGMSRVARAAPDGYTLGMGTSSTLTQIAQKLTPLRNDQFTPIARVAVDPLILIASTQHEARDLPGFLDFLRRSAGKASIGTVGSNNLLHAFAEMTARSAGAPYINVPYPGSGRVIADLAGRQIDAAVLKPSESKSHIDAGNVRALGVFAERRLDVMPDVPTFKELGHDVFPHGPLVQMSYVVAPANLPADTRAALIKMFSSAIESAAFKDWADRNGTVISELTGDALAREVEAVQKTLNIVGEQIFKKEAAAR